jgi:hypothetical protein
VLNRSRISTCRASAYASGSEMVWFLIMSGISCCPGVSLCQPSRLYDSLSVVMLLMRFAQYSFFAFWTAARNSLVSVGIVSGSAEFLAAWCRLWASTHFSVHYGAE